MVLVALTTLCCINGKDSIQPAMESLRNRKDSSELGCFCLYLGVLVPRPLVVFGACVSAKGIGEGVTFVLWDGWDGWDGWDEIPDRGHSTGPGT